MNGSFESAVLDSLTDHIAVLDHDGIIQSVNKAWRQFAWRNGCTRLAAAPLGINYLDICKQPAARAGGADGSIAAAGIRAVLDGRRTEFQHDYPCHSPGEQRWFRMTVTRLWGSATGAVVSHQNVTARKRAEFATQLTHAMLRQAAEEDPLTGLPNRTILMQQLHHLLERCRAQPGFCFALLFLDVDRFKLVNDTLGHEAGDELLRALGQRLRDALAETSEQVRTQDSAVARFSADEFVYVAAGIQGVTEAAALAERLRILLSRPYTVRGQEIQSTISIGIAMGESTSTGPQELLRNADIALYEAKRAGVSETVIFDQPMHDRLARRLQLETAMRVALPCREFTLLYQPIVDLDSGRMISVEALLRWTHAQFGPVSPNEFIPIAEETGLIVPLGEWVLREACLQWARWQIQRPGSAPAGMSVNLSRVQIALGDRLLRTVSSALDRAQMPPSALQLEITEREVMKDPARARELLLGLRDMGVRMAMDDFGTGTSSLACLRDYPFDSIKIDKTFITHIGRDPHVLAVAHATINVIENLGMTSVAEGIEETQVLAMLQAMGCRCGQGYLFARPMPADQVIDAMQRADVALHP